VHAGLYLSPHTISIGVIGPGTVAACCSITRLAERAAAPAVQTRSARSRVLGSQRMLLADPGVTLGDWRARYQDSGTAAE